MLYAERHRPRSVGLAGAVHRTWAVAEKNDWQFSNPRIDTGVIVALYRDASCCVDADDAITGVFHCQWGFPRRFVD